MSLFCFFSINAAIASGKYSINITNENYDYLYIEPFAGKCMHIWNIPNPGATLPKGRTISFQIEDSNNVANTCENAKKIANWNVTPKGKDTSVLTFEHYLNNVWMTEIYSDNKYNITASCQQNNSQTFINCYGTAVGNVENLGQIFIKY